MANYHRRRRQEAPRRHRRRDDGRARRRSSEADGDFDKAVEILRIKGAKDVDKRGASATAANGLVAAGRAARIDRARLRDRLRRQERAVPGARRRHRRRTPSSSRPADAEALLAETLADGTTVAREHRRRCPPSSARSSSSRRVAVLDGQVATYLHRKATDLPPQVGVLVAVRAATTPRPPAASRCRSPRCARGTSPATRSRPTSSRPSAAIAEATAREEGKPEAALPKIVEGGSTASSRTTCCSSRRRCRTKKTVKAGARRGRRHRHRLRPLRGRPGLTGRLRSSRHDAPQTGATDGGRHAGRHRRATAAVDSRRRDARRPTPERRLPPGAAQAVRRGVRRRRGSASTPTSSQPIARQIAEVVAQRRRRSPSSSAAATSSAAPSCPSAAWTAPAPTTWACSAPS